MGDDPRSFEDVIDFDSVTVHKLDTSCEKLADRMKQITDQAVKGLGNWVHIDEKRQARIDEAKGTTPCPWPHPAAFAKRVTTLAHADYDYTINWTDLSIHMIKDHCFFEGRGSKFRLEPEILKKFLF